MTIYVDTETTGLSNTDEIVEIAIVDDTQVLLNTLVRPRQHEDWIEAQGIHGISPDMVKEAPTYDEIRATVASLFKGQDVVIYNADYDRQYLHQELKDAHSVKCCMLAYTEKYGEWNDWHQSYTWVKLIHAAKQALHQWTGDAHRALSDTLATRTVWKYLTDTTEHKRVEAIHRDRRQTKEANHQLSLMEHRHQIAENDRALSFTRFLEVWWLRKTFRHWINTTGYAIREYEWCLLFYGKPPWLVRLEDTATTIYRKKKEIPENLRPESYFKQYGGWFTHELQPSGSIFIGKKTGWHLYDVSEFQRIKKLYPLRLAYPTPHQGEWLVSKTEAKKLKIDIHDMQPVLEEQTGYGNWYYRYRVKAIEKTKADQ